MIVFMENHHFLKQSHYDEDEGYDDDGLCYYSLKNWPSYWNF